VSVVWPPVVIPAWPLLVPPAPWPPTWLLLVLEPATWLPPLEELATLEPPALLPPFKLALVCPAWAPPEAPPPPELLLQAEKMSSAQPTTVAFCEEIPRRLVMAPSRDGASPETARIKSMNLRPSSGAVQREWLKKNMGEALSFLGRFRSRALPCNSELSR
jgi:hypothetical protein